MIAIDTNVLLRYLLADDIRQHRRAAKVVRSQQLVLITDVVLVETIWTLTGKRYALGKELICEVVRSILGDTNFVFENWNVVWAALLDYESAELVQGKSLNFPDALIVEKANFFAFSQGIGNLEIYSFDKALGQLRNVKQP